MIFISCYIVLPVLAALITTLLLLMNDKQKKDETVQLDTIDTSNYIVMDIKDNDNVYVDKIVTLPQTYISIENQIEQLINERYKDSGFIKSSGIYFNDAVLSRYISQDGSQISILGYVQDNQICLVDIDSNIDQGIGEINSNLDRGLNAVYKTDYADKIVKYLEKTSLFIIMGRHTAEITARRATAPSIISLVFLPRLKNRMRIFDNAARTNTARLPVKSMRITRADAAAISRALYFSLHRITSSPISRNIAKVFGY